MNHFYRLAWALAILLCAALSIANQPAYSAAPPVGGVAFNNLAPASAPTAEGPSISASDHHTCALTGQGGVQCWGENLYGQLGDGGKYPSGLPLDVHGLQGGVIAIVTGGRSDSGHSCALLEGGKVKCWGQNWAGQLGIGHTSGESERLDTPQDVVSLQGALALAAGSAHTCALLESGQVKCWGANWAGQLGNGETTLSATPANVLTAPGGAPLSSVKAIAASGEHTCALLTSGQVRCWGLNDSGQLGDGTTTTRTTPVTVLEQASGAPLSGMSAIAAGGRELDQGHACALNTAGAAWCWGNNASGQLGDGSTTNQLKAVPVTALAQPARSLSAGGGHTCAVLTSGQAQCWGSNAYGQLGQGASTALSADASSALILENVSEISAGARHTCARLSSGLGVGFDKLSQRRALSLSKGGDLRCWGDDRAGQVGVGRILYSLRALDVASLSSGVKSITAGGERACALLESGQVQCWGWNNSLPTPIASLPTDVRQVSVGGLHACALDGEGKVWCWGSNYSGQLGDGTRISRSTPVRAGDLSGALSIALGDAHTCAVLSGGGLKCWGHNLNGQVGIGNTEEAITQPSTVQGIANVAEVQAGIYHTCARTAAGGMMCWGANSFSQLGNGQSTSSEPLPVNVTAPGGTLHAAVLGGWHSCALLHNHTLRCWGNNETGQLARGTFTFYETDPAAVPLASVQQADGGTWHACAVVNSGVQCWGRNASGELGDGSTINRATPGAALAASGLPLSDIAAVDAGLNFTCALTTAGGVKCWGSNGMGQLGDGAAMSYATPQVVVASTTLTPDAGGRLQVSDAYSRTTSIIAPPGAVLTTTTLAYAPYFPASLPPTLTYASRAFQLATLQGGAPQPYFTFQAPVTLTVEYRPQDIAGLRPETLKLYALGPSGWQDAAQTCQPPSTYQLDQQQNRLSVTICSLGQIVPARAPQVTKTGYTPFALLGESAQRSLFLPLCVR